MTYRRYIPVGAPQEEQPSIHQVITDAMQSLLIEKGVIDADEVTRMVQTMDMKGTDGPRHAARIVVRSWLDPQYKTRLLTDPKGAARELGAQIGATELFVVENTEHVHNLIVCTLCSCYPREFLGRQPAWYKSRAYRARAVREPRAVLKEFGLELPAGVEVRVHDSSADLRYMVLPLRPAGTEGWSSERLEQLVTRDCLIGVAVPRL
jgi:nitrile hydratase